MALRWLIDKSAHSVAKVGAYTRDARRRRAGIHFTRDLAYARTGDAAQTLDVVRDERFDGQTLPALVYIHGGGFCICSKDTHWSFAVAFARRGYAVFNINYRLAPHHPYPAAAEDALTAVRWVRDNAARFDADPDRIVIAGESAGGNLTAAVVAATSYRSTHYRPTEVARDLFESGFQPTAAIISCAVLQVSDQARFWRDKPHVRRWIRDTLTNMEIAYLGDLSHGNAPPTLADPLRIIEQGAPDRPLPPLFVFCGTKDILLDDTRRLGAAVRSHGTECQLRVYPGEIHAFHALPWKESSRACWAEQRLFLDAHV